MTGNVPQLTPPPSQPNDQEANREMKRLTLLLLGSVIVLDGIVIGIYYALHIPDRTIKMQESFVAVWVVLTLLLVTTLMKKIRKLRPRRRR